MSDPNRPSPPAQRADPDDVALTRSEEELWIATRRRESGRARLIKHLEDETQTIAVELRRERVEVEHLAPEESSIRRPASPGNGGGERWLVLYEEQVVVETRWVAYERVRLRVNRVTEQQEVSRALRRERVEMQDTSPGGHR